MHREVLAEVALEADDADAVVVPVDSLQASPRVVRRPVVHEDELERLAQRVERGNRAPVQLGHAARLVVERDDDG